MEKSKHYNAETDSYICDCGKEFKTYRQLFSHGAHCKKYIKEGKKVKVSKYKQEDGSYICECGYKTLNSQSLNAHLSHCDFHHECIGTIRKKHASEIKHSMNWENKSLDEIKKIHSKSEKTYHDRILRKEIIPHFLGKKHKEESKRKIRESTIKYLEENTNFNGPRYNSKGCEYIDNLNKIKKWNLQHAKNGGEFKCCGYFLDGYDKDLNIAFEYDEPSHYKDVYNNILSEKDMKRQKEITNELNCTFWRYNEKLDLLYEVKI